MELQGSTRPRKLRQLHKCCSLRTSVQLGTNTVQFIKSPTRCNSVSNLLVLIYMKLNM